MAVTGRGLIGTGSATTAGTTITVTNTTGATIPAGTFIHITGAWDNIASVTAPTITSSTVGGVAPTANHATAIGSGVTTTAGSGIWHQCFRVLTTSTIASGATIATLTSNQSAVKRAAHAEGFDQCTATLRGTVTTATSAAGTPTVTTTGTALVIGDLVIGSISLENNAQATADADTTGGAWPPIVGIATSGGGAAANVDSGSQYKILTATGTQTFNPTCPAADAVVCVYSLVPVPDPTFTQAAYRMYADGTESGSTALAAQNTAPEVDVSGGDVNLGLRVRVQSTNAGSQTATDDYRLQWDLNAAGSWTDLTSAGPVSLNDSWTTTPNSSFIGAGDTYNAAGQTFVATTAGYLTSAEFGLGKFGAPPGTVVAKLYAHTGTYGTSSGIPTGAALATSTARNASTLQTTWQWESFTFDGTYALVGGTPYVITVEYIVGDGSNDVTYRYDPAISGHAGRTALRAVATGVWTATVPQDTAFRVYTAGDPTTVSPYASANLTDGAATTNRLGAGTGSFVAGEVSEDGLIDDLLITANNHTELLYSITLKQADLTDGDTLTFRVLRNAATTGLTYTAVPTIDIGGGVPTVTGTAALTLAVTATVDGTPTTYGTALTSSAVDVTATGVRETFGTALITITGNASATSGGVIVPGTAELIQSTTIDVAGTVIAEIVTGTALLTQSVDVTAAGSRFAIVTGTAAITQSVDVTVAGTVIAEVVTGTAVLTQSTAITAQGTVIAEVVSGTAALTQSVAVTAQGTVIAEVVTGTAAITQSVAVTVAGTVVAEVVTGTALISSSVAVTAAGTVTVPGGGVALVTIPIAITAQGTVVAEVVTGTALISVTPSVTATGARIGTGTALISSSVTVTAAGIRAGVTAGTALLAGSVAIAADGTVVAEVVTGTALIASSVTIVVSVLKIYERAPYTATWSLLYSGTLELDARHTRDFDYAAGWDTNARATVDHDYAHSWELV